MEDLAYLSALEIGKKVNEKSISPTEVLKYFEERIKVRNPSINAFVYTKFEDAYTEAKLLEERLAKGENCGPFAGVPIGLKDFLPSKKGWMNDHGGVKALTRLDDFDSEFYAAAKRLGAIAIGKTNAPAFAFRGTTDNKLYGPTSTPFNVKHNSGGSSGGTAAAVADGLIPLGEGSDGGGSIRIPSSWCNCFGYKPSVGLVPSVCRPDGWTATHPYCFNGAITRNVADAKVIYNEMFHYDAADPLSLPFASDIDLHFTPNYNKKIAVTYDFDLFDTDPEIVAKVEEAVRVFEKLGYRVDLVHFNWKTSLKEMAEMWCRSISIDTSIDLELWKKEGLDLVKDHREELNEEFIKWQEIAIASKVMDYRRFNEIRTEILDAQNAIFKDYVAILAPVTSCLPVLNTDDRDTMGPKDVEPLIGFCETFFENFTGNPACSVSAGLSKDNLPIGLQIIGRKWEDSIVFDLARRFEGAQPWDYIIPASRKV